MHRASEEGHIVAIIGSATSGKDTTLLNGKDRKVIFFKVRCFVFLLFVVIVSFYCEK